MEELRRFVATMEQAVYPAVAGQGESRARHSAQALEAVQVWAAVLDRTTEPGGTAR